jgi:predicted peptidase
MLTASRIFRLAPLIASIAWAAAPADPLYQSKGDQRRTYHFDEAGKDMPYRLYVPKSWEKGRKLPLVVILHGAGMDENGPFDRAPADLADIVQRQAEAHGFIVVSPLGYSDHGGFGASVPLTAPGQPAITQEEADRRARLSEKDVFLVIARVTDEYGADPDRTYLMGNSMGMFGTLHLARKYPDRWAAIAPSGGGMRPAQFDCQQVKGLPAAIFLRGDRDDRVPIEDTRKLSEGFQKQGVDTRFLLVKGGTHSSTWYLALPDVFNFFAQHQQHRIRISVPAF